jgi:hypothetical protein
MQQLSQSSDWEITWGYLKAFVPVLVVLLGMHIQNRRDAKKEKKDREEKDQVFKTLLKEYPIHSHTESSGQLNVSGVRYPKNNLDH